MSPLIQQMIQLHDFISPPNRNVWIKPIAYLLATLMLLAGFGIGGWALYTWLLDLIGQTYALLSVSIGSLLLSLISFLIGSKWRADKSGFSHVTDLVSNIVERLPDAHSLKKVIKVVPPQALVLILAGTWIASQLLGHRAKTEDDK
jgi:hypothetical protein